MNLHDIDDRDVDYGDDEPSEDYIRFSKALDSLITSMDYHMTPFLSKPVWTKLPVCSERIM